MFNLFFRRLVSDPEPAESETPKNIRQIYFKDLYFEKGHKRIDCVIVFSLKHLNKSPAAKLKFDSFVENLSDAKIDTEISYFSINTDIGFLKLHASENVLTLYADACNIELARDRPQINFVRKIKLPKIFQTDLSIPDPDSEVYQRAPESVSGAIPVTITQAERSLIMTYMLETIRFGTRSRQRGLHRLKYLGAIIDSYPLHEGGAEWTKQGPLCDRQLLYRYWANAWCWYKEQPLDLIEKYFGSNLGFYFNFLGFYNMMLMWASAASIIFSIMGFFINWDDFKQIHEEVCSSDKIMCPRCNPEWCNFEPLKDSCLFFRITYCIDNYGSFLMGIFITIWGTLFLELWGRREKSYLVKWNLTSLETNIDLRPEYENIANTTVVSPITGLVEPALSFWNTIFRSSVTVVTMSFLVLIMVVAVLAIIYLRTVFTRLVFAHAEPKSLLRKNVLVVGNMLSSIISTVIIVGIDTFYSNIATWLTDLENPRTESEYNTSFILRCYVLAFVNNYSMVFYIAFLKGKFYSYPGDHFLYTAKGSFKADLCLTPAGCEFDMLIQVVTILGFKHLILNCIFQILLPFLTILMRKFLKILKKADFTHKPQWEKDYLLNEVNVYLLVNEYVEISIRYGMVMFFTQIFPLAPILALLCNLAEIRVDSYKYIKMYRRPVAAKILGIQVWKEIFFAMTWLGVLINALILVLTKDVVYIQYYKSYYKTLDGYVDSKLLSFHLSDYKSVSIKNQTNLEICYYPGIRTSHDDENEYEQHFLDLFGKTLFALIFIFVYEHIIWFCTAMLAFMIPDVSKDVVTHIHTQDMIDARIRKQAFDKGFSVTKRQRVKAAADFLNRRRVSIVSDKSSRYNLM